MKNIARLIFITVTVYFLSCNVTLAQKEAPDKGFKIQPLTGKLFNFILTYEGQIFLFDEYSYGDIYLESGDIYSGLRLRYCGVTDELIYFNEANNRAISIDKGIIEKFIIHHPLTGEALLFKKESGLSGIYVPDSPVFAQVLYEKEIRLLALRQNRVEGVKSKKQGVHTYYQEYYAPVSRYVMIKPGSRPVFFTKINRKLLVRLFPNQERQIKTLVKEKKIRRRIRNEMDLIRVVSQMDDV